jgi:hypothetical protein
MPIQVTYRRTSRLSMRIVKNGDVHVSVPFGVSRRDVEAFIAQHRDWIESARKKTEQRLQQRARFYAQLPLATKAERSAALLRLKALVEPMVARYAQLMDVSPSVIVYKPLKSRWGQCHVLTRTITFSTYLLLLPNWCVEHVVVHELCHLLEPSHNARFHALMDRFYPNWRSARQTTRRISK